MYKSMFVKTIVLLLITSATFAQVEPFNQPTQYTGYWLRGRGFIEAQKGFLFNYMDSIQTLYPHLFAKASPDSSLWWFDMVRHRRIRDFYNTPTVLISFNGRSGAVVPANNDYTFAQIASKPTTIEGYGILNGVRTDQTYPNPSWITSLDYSKITNTPAFHTGVISNTYLAKSISGSFQNSSLSDPGPHMLAERHINYNADYSANYSARTLIDVGYLNLRLGGLDSVFVHSMTTTNNTITALDTIYIPNTYMVTVDMEMQAHNVANNETYSLKKRGYVKNISGTPVVVGVETVGSGGIEASLSTITWNVSIVGGLPIIVIQGLASTTIKWQVTYTKTFKPMN